MINKLKINSSVYSVLKDKINNNSFPWYEGNTPTDYSPNITFLYHEIVTRDGNINSFLYDDCKKLLDDLTKQLNISINKILRCCVNFTYNQSVKNCDFHVDHDFPHKTCIVYLNTLDHAATCICDEKYEKGKQVALPASSINFMKYQSILPEEKTFIYFDGLQYHANEYPNCGKQRKVIVYTFT